MPDDAPPRWRTNSDPCEIWELEKYSLQSLYHARSGRGFQLPGFPDFARTWGAGRYGLAGKRSSPNSCELRGHQYTRTNSTTLSSGWRATAPARSIPHTSRIHKLQQHCISFPTNRERRARLMVFARL